MTSRIVCKNCGAESFADGASLACWKCYTNLQAEVERLRAGLEFYANPVNWWWDSERNSWIWMGDNHPDMTACRALAGEEQ